MSFRNRSATVSATFHLTHACNLRCTYCYTGEKTSVGMSRETAQRAVEFCLAQAGRDEAEHLEIVFFGGEPLLKHSLLCEIVDLLRASAGAMRVSFKMSTNGLLLTETVVDDLARQEVFISLSLDGCYADADSDMSWAHSQDPEQAEFTSSNAKGGGRLIFGRVTYEMMKPFWTSPQAAQMMPDVAAGVI